jgi:uncharacterized phage-associated protein
MKRLNKIKMDGYRAIKNIFLDSKDKRSNMVMHIQTQKLFIYAPGPSSKAWGIKSVYFQRTV